MQKAMHGYLNSECYKVFFLRGDLFPNRHYARFVHTVSHSTRIESLFHNQLLISRQTIHHHDHENANTPTAAAPTIPANNRPSRPATPPPAAAFGVAVAVNTPVNETDVVEL